MFEQQHLVDAIRPVVKILQSLNVRHYIGGSVASSFHGAVRSTMDVDLICALKEAHSSDFIAMLSEDFYWSEAAIKDAVERKSSFNLIHLASSIKVDIFVSRGRAFDQDCMNRANIESLGQGSSLQVHIATAEDSIISKLEWYKIGNEESERQWDDVTRLIRLLGGAADYEYLTRAAASIGVEDLLARLRQQTED